MAQANSNLIQLRGSREQFRKSNTQSGQSTDRNISTLWLKLTELYGDKWTNKNGAEPSLMWKQALSTLSDQQLDGLFKFCIDRCMNGNPWPPELSDVIVALSDDSVKQNPFGISFDVMLTDWKRYCRDRGMYDSAEMYPYRHHVQYWIFTDIRRKMIDLRMTEPEVEKALKKSLLEWSEKVAAGGKIPKPTLRLADKSKPRPAWMDLIEKGKQRTQ